MGRSTCSPRMEDLLDFDIRRVVRHVGPLDKAHPFTWQWFRRKQLHTEVQVIPTQGGVNLTQGFGRQSRVFISVVATPCHYGGVRLWWACPGCSGRVAILYAGSRFVCRKCHHLTYTSQKSTQSDRAIEMAEKVRTRLKWQPGIANQDGTRPKGMHRSTYQALIKKHNDRVGFAFRSLGMMKMFRRPTV